MRAVHIGKVEKNDSAFVSVANKLTEFVLPESGLARVFVEADGPRSKSQAGDLDTRFAERDEVRWRWGFRRFPESTRDAGDTHVGACRQSRRPNEIPAADSFHENLLLAFVRCPRDNVRRRVRAVKVSRNARLSTYA
jgi:hypothetical protein